MLGQVYKLQENFKAELLGKIFERGWLKLWNKKSRVWCLAFSKVLFVENVLLHKNNLMVIDQNVPGK